jgi:hypothetical protein
MSPQQLLMLILGVSALVVAIVSTLFVIFYRFLKKEQKRGENFRSVHRDD